MPLMNARFDELYIDYSRLLAYGVDLHTILKEMEQREEFENCLVISYVLKDKEATNVAP